MEIKLTSANWMGMEVLQIQMNSLLTTIPLMNRKNPLMKAVLTVKKRLNKHQMVKKMKMKMMRVRKEKARRKTP